MGPPYSGLRSGGAQTVHRGRTDPALCVGAQGGRRPWLWIRRLPRRPRSRRHGRDRGPAPLDGPRHRFRRSASTGVVHRHSWRGGGGSRRRFDALGHRPDRSVRRPAGAGDSGLRRVRTDGRNLDGRRHPDRDGTPQVGQLDSVHTSSCHDGIHRRDRSNHRRASGR